MLVVLNIVTAMFAIASAFCWFRSAVAPNTKEGFWQKLSYPIDSYLEKTSQSTWNWRAASLTALAAFCQGVVALISAFNLAA